jgi:hypothetical protein
VAVDFAVFLGDFCEVESYLTASEERLKDNGEYWILKAQAGLELNRPLEALRTLEQTRSFASGELAERYEQLMVRCRKEIERQSTSQGS